MIVFNVMICKTTKYAIVCTDKGLDLLTKSVKEFEFEFFPPAICVINIIHHGNQVPDLRIHHSESFVSWFETHESTVQVTFQGEVPEAGETDLRIAQFDPPPTKRLINDQLLFYRKKKYYYQPLDI